tara:strand:- start:755 stop:1405 length:651 start_codon:yes stop_codon:yes gene_type:complete
MAIELDKLIYIHVPKTGGTYVKHILLQQCGGKAIYGEHDPGFLIKQKLETKKKFFTFIRHPLSIICSAWGHWRSSLTGPSDAQCRRNHSKQSQKKNWSYNNHSMYWRDCIDENSLNITVYNFSSKHPDFMGNFFESYTNGIDIIGRQENLNDELSSILYQDAPCFFYNIHHTSRKNSYAVFPLNIKHKFIDTFMQSHKRLLDKYDYNYIPSHIKVV